MKECALSVDCQCIPGLVSVIIPTYNRAVYLIDALESVVKQSYRPLEIIVIDDGSKDDTKKILEVFFKNVTKDSLGFKFLFQENAGACSARNNGFRVSSGEYIQFLDSDDFIAEEKIADGVEALSKNEALDFVYCLRADFDSETKEISPWGARLADLENNLCVSEVVLKSVWTALPLFRRSVLEKTGGWNEELAAFQDWEYIGRIAYHAKKAQKIDKVQAYCRQHSSGRISKGHFGDPSGLVAAALASKSLLCLVATSQDRDRDLAMKVLGKKCISAIRVAVATGQRQLAINLVGEMDSIFSGNFIFLLKKEIYKKICILPNFFLRSVLGNAFFLFKNLKIKAKFKKN